MASRFHILTVGAVPTVISNLWDRISAQGGYRMEHVAHPSYDPASWPKGVSANPVYFIREEIRAPLPPADPDLLASLERDDVPTIHNMILSDRVVSQLPYAEALAWATVLARRLFVLYEQLRPDILMGAYDGLHGSLGFAVARRLGIPWYALMFTALPPGRAAFATNLTPTYPVLLDPQRKVQLRGEAERLLCDFEQRAVRAAAYIPPRLWSPSYILAQLPAQAASLRRVLRHRRLRRYVKYSDSRKSYSLRAMASEALRLRRNLWLIDRRALRMRPPERPFAFFGLHMQPESSIDVFAHFFSNQERVIELIARSLPPTHILCVKLHKSDTPNYSNAALARYARFPGVELVSPYADSFQFIRQASLVFSIQGTIGLEAALLGKPVIVFGDSPSKRFPSVAMLGKTIDLPALVRHQLTEPAPRRAEIVAAFASYLAPFYPAAHNDWQERPSEGQIADFVSMFELLRTREPRATAEMDA